MNIFKSNKFGQKLDKTFNNFSEVNTYKTVCFGAILCFLASCASNPYKVREINTQLDHSTKSGASTIGVNKRGEAIYQTETSVADEVRLQKWQNNQLASEVKSEKYQLSNCRKDLADARLGGSGEITPLPEIDQLEDESAIREKLGINEGGKLTVLKRAYLKDHIQKQRQLNTSLSRLAQIIKNSRAKCESKMGAARVRAGLSSKRYNAEGYFRDSGSWVQTQKPESSLDDAFEIARKKSLR